MTASQTPGWPPGGWMQLGNFAPPSPCWQMEKMYLWFQVLLITPAFVLVFILIFRLVSVSCRIQDVTNLSPVIYPSIWTSVCPTYWRGGTWYLSSTCWSVLPVQMSAVFVSGQWRQVSVGHLCDPVWWRHMWLRCVYSTADCSALSLAPPPLGLHVCAQGHDTMSVPVQHEASKLWLHHGNTRYVMTLSEYLIHSVQQKNLIATINQYHIDPSRVTSLGRSELQFGRELSHFIFHYASSS